MIEVLSFIIIFLVSYVGVESFRKWTLRRELLDIPNERSSHTNPTPRGGGAVIVVVCLIGYAFYTVFISGNFKWAYLLGAILIAGISWLDDLRSISFYWRFLAHSISALLLIVATGYFQVLSIPLIGTVELGQIGAPITFLWVVWLTNAYNFMDGIDGIAGMQAFTAGLGWMIVGKLLGLEIIGFYGGVIAFSSLGFLLLNWQPAKIFMGDVGSAFLGYSFAALPLLENAGNRGASSANFRFLPIIAVIIVWLFVFDTIFTFARRVFKREKVWEAHRGHIYQRFVIAGFSHRAITSLYGFISILTIAVMLLWLIKSNFAEIILISIIGLQSLGLLFCLPVGKRIEAKN